MYDYLIVTHLPAFYKVNLYNELSKNLKVKVLFIGAETLEKRSDDFAALDKAKFEYVILNENAFQKRKVFFSLYKVFRILLISQYKKIILSGWDLPEFWMLAFLSKKSKNCLALESTIYESNTKGIRGRVKKIFTSRISRVFASGSLHKELLHKLNYHGVIQLTGGVGIINKSPYVKKYKAYQKRFLFVGRLTTVKNLELLISVFNELPLHSLTIVGEGNQTVFLKSKANSNIIFLGNIDNHKLKEVYDSHDIFILPSIREPWGLVVDEALYFGLPVIISERCGASDLIKDSINGFLFNPFDRGELLSLVERFDDDLFQSLTDNLVKDLIENKDQNQVLSYE